jgi:SAM-dependent methyltransferase
MKKNIIEFIKLNQKDIYNDGERIIPNVTSHNIFTERMHKASYEFIKEIIIADSQEEKCCNSILDLGCGVGYGTFILSSLDCKIDAVEIDDLSLNYANLAYNHVKINYINSDIVKFIENIENSYDYVVSIQVLEHIINGIEIGSRAKYKKRLIINVPYDEKPGNPFHVLLGINEVNLKEKYNKAEIFFQEESTGIIFDYENKPEIVGGIYMILSNDNMKKVSDILKFPTNLYDIWGDQHLSYFGKEIESLKMQNKILFEEINNLKCFYDKFNHLFYQKDCELEVKIDKIINRNFPIKRLIKKIKKKSNKLFSKNNK